MRKSMQIQVLGTQQFLDGREERSEFETSAAYYRRNGAYYLIYRESELTGLEGVTTTLRIERDNLILKRMGRVQLRQEYRQDLLSAGVYATPFGKIPMSVRTSALESDLTAMGGRITLKYDLYVDEELVSHNGLTIIIKEDLPQ